MKDRVAQLIKEEKLSSAEFAERIGISPASVSAILNGRHKVSLDVVIKIMQTFEYVSWEWLVFGKGELNLLSDSANHNSEPSNSLSLFDEIQINPSNGTDSNLYAKENAVKENGIDIKDSVRQGIKYVETPVKKICEIRVFYDDNTFEIFKP